MPSLSSQWSLLGSLLCPIHVVRFMPISNLVSDLITDLISDFGIAFMLNYTIRSKFATIIYGMINMEV